MLAAPQWFFNQSLCTLAAWCIGFSGSDPIRSALAKADDQFRTVVVSAEIEKAGANLEVVDFKRRGEWFLLRHKINATENQRQRLETVLGANSKYGFKVLVEEGVPRVIYVGSTTASLLKERDYIISSVGQAHMMFYHSTLHFYDSQESHWKYLGADEHANHCMEYSGTIIHPMLAEKDKATIGVSGKVTFRPDTGLIVRHEYAGGRADLDPKFRSRSEVVVTLDDSGCLPMMMRIVSRAHDGQVFADTTTRVKLFSMNAPSDEADYSFTAIGLDEPHGVTWPRPTPYWLYGTLGSVAVIGLGILLMRWSQRRSAPAAG